MALNLCRRSFATITKCSTQINTQTLLRNQIPVVSRLLTDTNPILRAAYASDERSQLGLRKQKLPPFPAIECIRSLYDIETFLPSYYKLVKYGDYEFLECKDGFVQVYIHGYIHPRNLDAKAGFAVYYGDNHPLNMHGPIERRQSMNSAKMYAFMKVFQHLPENLIKKLCICVDELTMITFINQSLRNMSENSFRSVHTGKLNKDLETSMEINRLLRLRQDLVLRMKFVPNDIAVNGIYQANRLAIKAADKACQLARQQRSKIREESFKI